MSTGVAQKSIETVCYETILGRPIFPIDKKVADSVIKRLTTEALDLDRFYYSTDLSKKNKEDGLEFFLRCNRQFFLWLLRTKDVGQ